jgi:hypothetical protein
LERGNALFDESDLHGALSAQAQLLSKADNMNPEMAEPTAIKHAIPPTKASTLNLGLGDCTIVSRTVLLATTSEIARKTPRPTPLRM